MPNTINNNYNIHANTQEKKPTPAIRAYLGGSFDPVHNGHLQMALYVYQSLLPLAKQQQCELQVSLLPNARSPFKTDSTAPEHRLAMLKLAIKDTPLKISELELWQTPPVYTIDSVKTLRACYPHDSLIFIMGMDSARSLDKWKDGLALTDYVNLWVFNRLELTEHVTEISPTTLSSQLPSSLQKLTVNFANELLTPVSQGIKASSILKTPYRGHIYIDSRAVMAISSTQVRQQLQQSLRQTPHLLNVKHAAETQIASLQPINDIIGDTAPNSFAKWLNPAVYQYIIVHQLYSAAQFR